MQKRSHTLLAAALLKNQNGLRARRYELAFLFGSFEPDCNPLSYLKGSLRSRKFRGHNYTNSDHYIANRIQRLQNRKKAWTCWQYYTLGKLTHYLADAFTYPHNENYPDSLRQHRRYEDELREYLAYYLKTWGLKAEQFSGGDLLERLQALHRQYMESVADMRRDVRYIIEANSLLMAGLLPVRSAAV